MDKQIIHTHLIGKNWTDKCSPANTTGSNITAIRERDPVTADCMCAPVHTLYTFATVIIAQQNQSRRHRRRRKQLQQLVGMNTAIRNRNGIWSSQVTTYSSGKHIAPNETISEKSKQIIYHAAFLLALSDHGILYVVYIEDGNSIR